MSDLADPFTHWMPPLCPTPWVTELAHPFTHWPYLTKRLACWWVIDEPRLSVVLIGQGADPPVPAWRLTPATFAWFWAAVENLAKRPNLNVKESQAAKDAVEVLIDMECWLESRGLAGDVLTARQRPVQPLADPPSWADVDAAQVDAGFNARRTRR